jgi:hypothetical protein
MFVSIDRDAEVPGVAMEVPAARLCPVHGGVNCSDGSLCYYDLPRRFQLPLTSTWDVLCCM